MCLILSEYNKKREKNIAFKLLSNYLFNQNEIVGWHIESSYFHQRIQRKQFIFRNIKENNSPTKKGKKKKSKYISQSIQARNFCAFYIY